MTRSTHRNSVSRLTFAVALTLAVSACGSHPFAPSDDGRRVLGAIEHYNNPVQVHTPDEVASGADFEVEIITYGGGCTRMGDTEVDIEGLRAHVAPYDIDTSKRGSPCTGDLVMYPHKATLRFDTPGTATIVFFGRRHPGGELLTVERTVEVR